MQIVIYNYLKFFFLVLFLLTGIPFSRNSGIPKGFDEADEVADVERAPGAAVEVEIREDGIVHLAFPCAFRTLVLGDEFGVEGADRFTDGAVFFEVGETDGLRGQQVMEIAFEVPGIIEHGTEGVVGAVFVEDVRPGHDSFFAVHNDVVVLKIKQNGTILLVKRGQAGS